jgi:thioredoxin 1
MTQTNAQPETISTVDRSTFAALVLDGAGPIAVEFMSYGCSHCRALEPILQDVASRVASSETVYRVNVALDEELARSYGIEGTPTLIMFSNGREVGRVEGPKPIVSTLLAAMTRPFQS